MKKFHFKQIRYHVAYKQSREKKFHIVKNNLGSWTADPFLFKYNGEIYIFAEMWVMEKGKGVIAYSKWNGKKFSRWNPVIEEKYHLSYPNIFLYDNQIYICPESNENNEICIYRAIEFPNKWEKVQVLAYGDKYVDTTFFKYEYGIYGFTYKLCENKKNELYLFKVENSKIVMLNNMSISEDDRVARPAGNCIEHNKKIIRVSQNCQGTYGKGLMFSLVDFDGHNYKEKLIREVYPKDITYENANRLNIIGIHTYNQIDDFQVIDLRSYDFSIQVFIIRIFNVIRKKLKGIKL